MNYREYFQSLESGGVENLNKRQPLTRSIKETAIFSNNLVKGVKTIKSFKTPEQCIKFALEEYKDAYTIDIFHTKATKDFIQSKKRLRVISKFSVEAAKAVYSMEEESQNPNFLAKIKQFFTTMFEKFVNYITALGKSIMLRIKTFTAQFSNKLFKNFKKEEFTNLDQTIKAIPFDLDGVKNVLNNNEIKDIDKMNQKMQDDLTKIESAIKSLKDNKTNEKAKEDLKNAIANYSTREGDRKSIKNKINLALYNQDVETKPESKEMTIGEYLNCKPGEEPKALQFLSPQSLDGIKKLMESAKKINKTLTSSLKVLKNIDVESAGKDSKLVNDINKLFNMQKNELNRHLVFYTYLSTELLNIRAKIAEAIRKGSKKVKEEKKTA